MSKPIDVVVAFNAAIAANDEDAARQLSVRWDADGDTPKKLFSQATRKRFRLVPLTTFSQPGRAAVAVGVLTERKPERGYDRIWLQVVEQDGQWRVAAVTEQAGVAAMFVDGLLAAGQRIKDLPRSEAAEQFVRGLLHPSSTEPGAQGVRDAVKAMFGGVSADVQVACAVKSEAPGRFIVEFGGGVRRGPWVLLTETDGRFAVQGASEFRDLADLAASLRVDSDVTEDKPMADEPKTTHLGAESPEVQAAVAKVFQDAIKQLAEGKMPGAPGMEKQTNDLFMNLVAAAMSKGNLGGGAAPAASAPGPDEADDMAASDAETTAAPSSPAADTGAGAPIDLAAERQKRGITPPSEFEKRMNENVRDALNDYVVDNVVTDGVVEQGEVTVGAEFLKEHGPQLFANVLQALAKSLIPEEIKIELPERKDPGASAGSQADGNAPAEADSVPAGEGGEASKPHVVPQKPGVKLKLDFNDIVTGLLSGLEKKSRESDDKKSE